MPFVPRRDGWWGQGARARGRGRAESRGRGVPRKKANLCSWGLSPIGVVHPGSYCEGCCF